MSAVETVQRVLRWAGRDDGPPPPGDLRSARQLLPPTGELAVMWPEFARLALARLHWSPPADPREATVGTSGLLLAAALGIVNVPEVAVQFLAQLPRGERLVDAAARHRLAERAMPYVPTAVGDCLRDISPLTAVLDRPAPGSDAAAFEFANRLLKHHETRRTLVNRLAQPTADITVRKWRTSILERWRVQAELIDTVLDVFESAVEFHGGEFQQQMQSRMALLMRFGKPLDDAEQAEVYSLVAWWTPWVALEQSHNDLVRRRELLGRNRHAVFDYVRTCQRLRGA